MSKYFVRIQLVDAEDASFEAFQECDLIRENVYVYGEDLDKGRAGFEAACDNAAIHEPDYTSEGKE